MSNYAATGNPGNGTRNISDQIRDEFLLIQNAISSKAERNASNSVSTTSITIGTGVKTLAIETGKELVGGQTVSIADTASPAVNYMIGILLSYDSTTGLAQVDVTAFGGSGTKTSWIIGLSNPAGVTLGSNTFTGAQNWSRATVASHATTADIWNASGNQINFTGTATVTSFPSAPQPGASRKLICAAACSFTASSDMIIDGVASGATFVCAANDVVTVEALTVSQFRLTIQRYDGKPVFWARSRYKFYAHTGAGHGSLSTMKRRLSIVVTNTGEAVAWNYTDSSTLGGRVTFIKPGLYDIRYADTGNKQFGLSKNQVSAGTTVFDSLTPAEKFLRVAGQGTIYTGSSITAYMESGDFIEMVTNGASWIINADPWTSLEIEGIA
jgi:hypothetical protein